jgi:hypothetical protein
MTPRAGLPHRNPFAAARVRPGALPFFFGPCEGLPPLVERLRSQGWWSQVVGPHGTGKSTLLAALVPELERQGLTPLVVRLHEGRGQLPGAVWQTLAGPGPPRVLVIDGFEQARFRDRRAVKAGCRRGGHGLVVTAHRGMGLPTLYRTAVTPALARRVVETLLAGADDPVMATLDVSALLAARRGDLRAVLFDLYDRYEERRAGPPG